MKKQNISTENQDSVERKIDMQKITFPFQTVTQRNRSFVITKIRAEILTNICYVARRGQKDEAGAVQRILNVRRIADIKKFTLNVGDYPSSVILNWTNDDNPLQRDNNMLSFFNIPYSAQIIDGQHRIEGIKSAINEKDEIKEIEIPVAIYENLSTKECADIFLSINTEQKPVARSLVFDLYKVASDYITDPATVRARDIAVCINEQDESPYYGKVKFPGSHPKKGGITLSTLVTAIKPLVEEKGDFEKIGFNELEMQKQAILNFLIAIQRKYKDNWEKKENIFQYAAGFRGAIDFLRLKIIPYCKEKKSFKIETIEQVFDLKVLIYQEKVKGLAGKEAANSIYEELVKVFTIGDIEPHEWEI